MLRTKRWMGRRGKRTASKRIGGIKRRHEHREVKLFASHRVGPNVTSSSRRAVRTEARRKSWRPLYFMIRLLYRKLRRVCGISLWITRIIRNSIRREVTRAVRILVLPRVKARRKIRARRRMPVVKLWVSLIGKGQAVGSSRLIDDDRGGRGQTPRRSR